MSKERAIERASKLLEILAKHPAHPDIYPGSIYDVLKVTDADVDRKVIMFRSRVLPEHGNNIGTMHGGAIMSLLDITTAISIFAY